jgi:hypothetical protein
MAHRPAYPEAVGIFRGADAELSGAAILAVDPDDWEGAQAVFDAVAEGTFTGDTDWSFGPYDGVPHAVLSFSSLQPPTHILIALSVAHPMHHGALAAAAESGYVLITPLSDFDALPGDTEGLQTNPARIVKAPIDAGRVRAFLANPQAARPGI